MSGDDTDQTTTAANEYIAARAKRMQQVNRDLKGTVTDEYLAEELIRIRFEMKAIRQLLEKIASK